MEKIDFLMQSMLKMSRLETGIIQIQKKDKICMRPSTMQLQILYRRQHRKALICM